MWMYNNKTHCYNVNQQGKNVKKAKKSQSFSMLIYIVTMCFATIYPHCYIEFLQSKFGQKLHKTAILLINIVTICINIQYHNCYNLFYTEILKSNHSAHHLAQVPQWSRDKGWIEPEIVQKI